MTADRLIAGRYRLAEKVGSGAMGVVWRATDERLERVVAVKQLLLTPGLTPEQALDAKQRAMREGRIAARLHHPNAITVFDVAEEDGQPWLVMEYMDAPSLAFKIAGGHTLPPLEVAEIGAQAASALAAAHDAGIMHRDVKPANLLVADDGTVKLTDFGISRAVGDVTVTATGLLAGTPPTSRRRWRAARTRCPAPMCSPWAPRSIGRSRARRRSARATIPWRSCTPSRSARSPLRAMPVRWRRC